MNFARFIPRQKLPVLLGGVLAALLGWQLCWLPLGTSLTHLSYDLPFLFSEGATTNLVLVELDEISHTELRQDYGTRWDRRLHAKVLDYLRREGASLIVFDIVFTEPGPDATADQEFAAAIRAHGRVVLAADVDDSRRNGILGGRILPPTDVLREATPHWGPTQAETEDDGVVRKIYRGTEQSPPMASVAAALAQPTVIRTNTEHFASRFVRYYGPGGTLTRISYSRATNQPAGFFRGKTVFIGGRPRTGFVGEETDQFGTPWRLHGRPQISGLELTATEFLNLSRGEFLTRLSTFWEFLFLAAFGIFIGATLACLRPRGALLAASSTLLAVFVLALILFFSSQMWFNWAVAAFVQIPCALVWSLGWQWWRLKKEKDWLESPLPALWDDVPAEKKSAVAAPKLDVPAIPDHEMLRQVGRGAYGDVWLARDALGNFHAVKIVRRVAFDHSGPFDREFRGLQRFTPISRDHPGLVHILHVGRDPLADYFYYIMEAGDDEKTGANIEPANYTPRNLGREIHRRVPIPPEECCETVAALCDALDFLHTQGLIHRDIKPANIIFVNGRPKLADIGLVTDISESRQVASSVGTEGYLPPEGPGTAAGDIFALGKVLVEMSGASADDILPPSDALKKIRAVISRACAEIPSHRFANAREMRDALRAAK